MGHLQSGFIAEFKKSFAARFDIEPLWGGGQTLDNCARLRERPSLRRNGIYKKSERFELGDLIATINGHKLIVEYDGSGVALHNLVKFWPYINNQMDQEPECPIIMCHFSDWGSYGAYRDLWAWMNDKMQQYPKSQMFKAQQFDHGKHDDTIRNKSIKDALDWLSEELKLPQA